MPTIDELKLLVTAYREKPQAYAKVYQEAIVSTLAEKDLDKLNILAACEKDRDPQELIYFYGNIIWPIMFYAIEANWFEAIIFLKKENLASYAKFIIPQYYDGFREAKYHYEFGDERYINAFQFLCAAGHLNLLALFPLKPFFDDKKDGQSILKEGLYSALCNARIEIATILIQSFAEHAPNLIGNDFNSFIEAITKYSRNIPCLELLIATRQKFLDKIKFSPLDDGHIIYVLKSTLTDNEKLKMLTLLRSIDAPFCGGLIYTTAELNLLFTVDKTLIDAENPDNSLLFNSLNTPWRTADPEETNKKYAEIFFFLLDKGANLQRRHKNSTLLEYAFRESRNQYIIAGLLQRGLRPERSLESYYYKKNTIDTIVQFCTLDYYTKDRLNKLIKQAKDGNHAEEYLQVKTWVKNPPIDLQESKSINQDVLFLLKLLSPSLTHRIFDKRFKIQCATIEYVLNKAFSIPINRPNTPFSHHYMEHCMERLSINLNSMLFKNILAKLNHISDPEAENQAFAESYYF